MGRNRTQLLGAVAALCLAGTGQVATAAAAAPAAARQAQAPQIDVVFTLDTTGSMSGLIEGAKQKIWSIASEIMETEETANVRFGLIAYRDRSDDYTTQVYDLTDDINGIYGHLLGFSAAGGGDRPESVNQALNEAVTQMQWSTDANALRMVFLVGDSPPNDYDDDIDYDRTCELATARDITVNTVLAGSAADTRGIWKAIATLCNGTFVEIPQDGGMQTVVTPYDDQLNQLQRQINATVLPYGKPAAQEYITEQREAALGADRSVASDMAAVRMKGAKANQIVTGGAARLDGGDLVEDIEDGAIQLADVPEDELPADVAALPADARAGYLADKIAERGAINAQMAELIEQRDAWLAEDMARRAESAEADSFDLIVNDTIRSRAADKGIVYRD